MTQYVAQIWPLAAMVGLFVLGVFAFKLPVSLSLVAAAIGGAAVGGEGFPLRHFVEGAGGYLDTLLIIGTAMIFMQMIQASGLLDTIAHFLAVTFRHWPSTLLVLMMLFAMSGGMITGSSTAAVLTTGALTAPVLMNMGISRDRTGAIIAMAGVLGMIAPPVNIPAMLIGGGVDLPYIGFGLPLLFLTVPLAVVIAFFLGLSSVKNGQIDPAALPRSYHSEYGWRLYAPLILLLVLIIGERAFPRHFPSLGMPLDFMACALITPFTGRRMNPLRIAREAIEAALPVMGILVGVGMFLQIMTLTGIRGFVVGMLIGVPHILRYLSIGVSMPLFGAVSSFGSASILGVPFVLSFTGRNLIIVAAALSLIAGLGDLMPPTALAGLFAAQVVKQENYMKILRYCFIPALLITGYGLGAITTADLWAGLFFKENHLILWMLITGLFLLIFGLTYFLDWVWIKRAKEET